MEFYIQAASAISPQKTFGPEASGVERSLYMKERTAHTGNRMTVAEPDYSTLIDPKPLRRMSRIIRMGVGAGVDCLRQAGVARPDAIVTGTAYGCLADTGVFLAKMIEQREEMLPPTAFIQSTHNTVGGQIALMLACHGYNNTFVHRGHSFESALLDAMLLLGEGEAGMAEDLQGREDDVANVLVGGIDEITDISHAILSRFGLYRHTKAGEGAAFFLLSGRKTAEAWARLERLDSFYKPKDDGEIADRVHSLLASLRLCPEDIDMVIMGNNGDAVGDRIYDRLASSVFGGCTMIRYKEFCGEYPTSTSFALWLATDIVRAGKARRILIYNHCSGQYHSLMVVSGVDL